MSLQFQREIFSKGKLKLFINIDGADENTTIMAENLAISIYAIDVGNNSHVFSEKLNYKQSLNLYNQLNSISILRDSSKTYTDKFIELNEDSELVNLISQVNANSLRKILEKANDDEKLSLVLEALTKSEIVDLYATIKQRIHKNSIEHLCRLLNLEESDNIVSDIKYIPDLEEYTAGQPEKIFQNWIEKNTWTLGVEYYKKHPARQIGISSESDLIMESTDGFIDLIELKRPKFNLLDFDASHKSYYPSKELAKVLGQCLLYLKTLDDYKLILEKKQNFKLVRPRIKIIMGRTNNFNEDQFEALRLLNSSLNHIEIVSYDYLVKCGENIIAYYDKI